MNTFTPCHRREDMTFEKWMPGYYRLSIGGHFAGIRKHDDRKWHVEIRESATGELRRYAGIWDTLRDGREEAEGILEWM